MVLEAQAATVELQQQVLFPDRQLLMLAVAVVERVLLLALVKAVVVMAVFMVL
jgi:hypothetical protein